MKLNRYFFLVLAACLILPCGYQAAADAISVNFDQVMRNVWTRSGVWTVVRAYGVMPPDLSLMPETCDINGGFDISQQPIVLYPNDILDSNEFALISTVLANPGLDLTPYGGLSHDMLHNAWTNNYNQVYHDLGGGVGGPEVLLGQDSLIPDLDYLIAGWMTIGDSDTIAFPAMLADLIVNDSMVNAIVGDPNISVPMLENYTKLYPYLGWCGDADGDGCSNLHEYQHFFPQGGRAAYVAAALNPAVKAPGCTGDLICDGSGGLFGEYFDDRNMTQLKVTRIDPQVSFDWGSGQPHPVIDANSFSVCWTGWVIPQYSEVYTFHVRTDDGVRLWVNDQLLVNEWNDHGSTTYSGTIATPLVAGQRYPIRMDFYENGGDAVAWLGWESANQSRKAIYEMYLEPGYGYGDRSLEWIRNPANGHFYRLTAPLLPAEGAALAATPEYSGYMVAINDAEENDWAFRMFGPVDTGYYLGGNDTQTEGRWVWTNDGTNFWNGVADGTAPNGLYANWGPGEPNNSGNNEDYVHSRDDGKWNDISGTGARRCLIESEAPHVSYIGPSPEELSTPEGTSVTLRVDVLRPWDGLTYQWRLNGEDLEGKTSATLTLQGITMGEAGEYTCVIGEGGYGMIIETEPAILTVTERIPVPAMGLIPGLMLASALVLGARRRFRKE